MFRIKRNNNLFKNIFNIIFFILFYKYIQTIDVNITGGEIFDYTEMTMNLSFIEHYIIYKYNLNEEKSNFILQLNSSSNIPINIYFYNNEKIDYKENGDFVNWETNYTSNINSNKEEFLFQGNKKECYIVFAIKKSYNLSYIGTFSVFQIPVDILLNEFLFNNSYFFYTYKNNYTFDNYNYRIDSKNLSIDNNNNKIYLHCMIKAKGTINITFKNGDDDLINEKKNISYLDYYLNITKGNIYNIIINIDIKSAFSVYYKIVYENDTINFIGNNNTICRNILGEASYYFYDEITLGNNYESFYYILKYFLSLNDAFVGYYNSQKYIDLKKINYEELYQMALKGNYTPLASKNEINDIIFYKYRNENINITNNNIIFIQIKINNFNNLNLEKICIRKLPLTKLNINGIGSYKKIYNNSCVLENIGYYYISYINYSNLVKNIFLYTSKVETITLYEGKFDIVEGNEKKGNISKNKILKLPIENAIKNGYTLKILNKDNLKFIFELLYTSINYLESSIYLNYMHPNKEIFINDTIQELYLFNNIIYINNNDKLIIEPKIIYGNLTLKYFNLDFIENDFNFDIKNIFENSNYGFKNFDYPILSNSSFEIIKIINNNFGSKKLSKGLLYINRYNEHVNIISKDNLIPFYLIKKKTKSIAIDNSLDLKIIDYQISLDSNYLSISEQFSITIKIKDQNLYLNKENNILKGKIYNSINKENNNIVLENSSNKYSFLIWIKLYISEDEEDNIPLIIPLSKSYYIDKPKKNQNFIFSFDWGNILNNIKIYEKYILINNINYQIICDNKNNNNNYISKGYYYQIITDNNTFNYDFYLSNSINTSIDYELTRNESHYFFQNNFEISELNELFKDNKTLHTIVYMNDEIPITKFSFYINYIYQYILEPNSLLLLDFSEKIYSLDINITQPTIMNNIFFQVLYCNNAPETEISLLYLNNYEVDYKKYDISYTRLSNNNYYGIINLNELKNSRYKFNIFLPQKMYFHYSYFDDNNNYFLYDNNNNYNIEIERTGNKLTVTFDRYDINIITNYSIIIKNNEETKITNECQFISLLSTYNKNNFLVYYSIDKGFTERVKIKIDMNDYGSYDIYIMAETLNDINIFKFMGHKEYNFTEIIDDNDENESNTIVIFLIISNILLILLVIGIFIYIFYKKKKNKKLINSLKNSNLQNSLLDKNSTQLNASQKENEKYDKPSTNENSDNNSNNISNIQDSNFNILNKGAPAINGSINDSEEKLKNSINNKDNIDDNNINNTEEGNNNIDNKNNEEDASESAAPAYNFIKTENPEEHNIGYIFADRNNIEDVKKEDDDIKKVFVNTDTTKG